MSKILASFALVILSSVLVACGGSGSAASDPGEDYRPELRAFDIIDSYDCNSQSPALGAQPLFLRWFVRSVLGGGQPGRLHREFAY